MCRICDGLHETQEIREPWQLKSIVFQIQGFLERNSVRVVRQNVSVEDILREHWVDYIEMVFACTGCGTRFTLVCETYHGSGGRWERAGQSEKDLNRRFIGVISPADCEEKTQTSGRAEVESGRKPVLHPDASMFLNMLVLFLLVMLFSWFFAGYL